MDPHPGALPQNLNVDAGPKAISEKNQLSRNFSATRKSSSASQRAPGSSSEFCLTFSLLMGESHSFGSDIILRRPIQTRFPTAPVSSATSHHIVTRRFILQRHALTINGLEHLAGTRQVLFRHGTGSLSVTRVFRVGSPVPTGFSCPAVLRLLLGIKTLFRILLRLLYIWLTFRNVLL